VRIATDDGGPAAHLPKLSGIVSPEPAGERRGLRRAGESDQELAIFPAFREQKYAFERARRNGQ